MVMMTLGSVEAVLANNPDTGSVDYRNAWATVGARLARSKDPEKLTALQALRSRLEAIGEPRKPEPLTREAALAVAQAANEARAIGRCKAAILGRIASAKWQRIAVNDRKPWMFEAALQMLEDGQVSLHQATYDFPSRGFEPVGGARPVKLLMLAPPDPEYSKLCPWQSRKKQAEEEARI